MEEIKDFKEQQSAGLYNNFEPMSDDVSEKDRPNDDSAVQRPSAMPRQRKLT